MFLLGGLLSAAAPHVWISIAGRALQGFGAGVISAQVLGIIQDEFTGRARMRALSGYSIAASTAAIAGPLFAGAVLHVTPDAWAWRAILALHVPFIAATIWAAVNYQPAGDQQPSRERSMDIPGVLLLGVLVVLVTIPVIDPVLATDSLIVALVLGPVLLAALVLWERSYLRRGRQPLFVPELLASPGFMLGSAVAALWFGSTLAKMTVVTLFLLGATDLAPLWVAAVMIPGACARIVAAAAASAVHQRLRGGALPAALAIETVSVALLIGGVWAAGGIDSIGTGRLVALVVTFALLSGVGSGLTEPVLRAGTLASAPAGSYGVAASFLQLAQRLAGTFMVALASGLLLGGTGLVAALAVSLVALAVSVVLSMSGPVRHSVTF